MAKDGDDEKASGRTPSVFISYASLDSAIAETACEALEKAGVTCWIAPRDVTPGAFYGDEIVHAIDAAKAIVLILSQNAATSPHVLREVERAASKRHAVISLRIDKAPLPAGLEYFLNTSQWLDASSGDTVRALPKLVSAVQVAIQAPAGTPTGVSTVHSLAPAVSARSRKRMVLLVASVVSLALVGFAADRLWVSSRRAATTAATTPVASVPVPVTAAPAIPVKSVAVLPFVDMSEKKDQEYFSDGLSEELIDMLTKVPELRVPARTSSFYFKGKQATVPEIAKALGVADVLEGSVRKSGNHLRITAQLVRADNGYHLWSETYDRQLDDIFKIQDEIAGAVVKALKLSLMGGSVLQSTGTQNIDSYNLFVQAKSIFWNALVSNESADYERVADYSRKAINADPRFADAWALLSSALVGEATAVPLAVPVYHQLTDQARRAAEQALKLNSARPWPHLAYGQILYWLDFRLRDADTQFQQALELDPNSPYALGFADQLPTFSGKFAKALEFAQKAIAIDPVNSNAYGDLLVIYYLQGRYPEALAANRKMLDLNPGARGGSHQMAANILLLQGDPTAALTVLESDKEARERCSCLVSAYDALGRKGDADAALANLEKHYADEYPYEIGLVHANRGELDQAFAWFDRAYRRRDSGLFLVKFSPFAKNARSDPRFNALLRKLDLLD